MSENICETSKSEGNIVEVFFVAGFLEMFLPIVYLKPSATIKDNENQKSVCNWLLRRTKCLIS